MNIQAALDFAQSEIKNIESQIDARYLLSFVTKKDFTWLKTWSNINLTNQQIAQLKEVVERRNNGEPIAYITGEKGFWTLTLKTDPSTLIPRAETELLVEQSLAFLSPYGAAKILDLGTGTGAIGLAIASERPNGQVMACDFEPRAVELAKRNAAVNKISNIKIFQSDWFSNVEENQFDLIVANPPYVIEDDPHLAQGDLIFEPNTALVSGQDGLADIEAIIQQAPKYLHLKGALIVEHGFEQGKQVRELFKLSGFIQIETFRDLLGLERMTLGVLQC